MGRCGEGVSIGKETEIRVRCGRYLFNGCEPIFKTRVCMMDNFDRDNMPEFSNPVDGDPVSIWETGEGNRYQLEQSTVTYRPAFELLMLPGRRGENFSE